MYLIYDRPLLKALGTLSALGPWLEGLLLLLTPRTTWGLLLLLLLLGDLVVDLDDDLDGDDLDGVAAVLLASLRLMMMMTPALLCRVRWTVSVAVPSRWMGSILGSAQEICLAIDLEASYLQIDRGKNPPFSWRDISSKYLAESKHFRTSFTYDIDAFLGSIRRSL